MLKSVMSSYSSLRAASLKAAQNPGVRPYCEMVKKIPQHREKSMNQVTLLGRTGGDAVSRGTQEHPVVQFSIATNTTYTKDGELKQNTVWHNVSVFMPSLRESVLANLKKGRRVMVQGKLSYMERRDPATQQIINKTVSILANDVIMFRDKE